MKTSNKVNVFTSCSNGIFNTQVIKAIFYTKANEIFLELPWNEICIVVYVIPAESSFE